MHFINLFIPLQEEDVGMALIMLSSEEQRNNHSSLTGYLLPRDSILNNLIMHLLFFWMTASLLHHTNNNQLPTDRNEKAGMTVVGPSHHININESKQKEILPPIHKKVSPT